MAAEPGQFEPIHAAHAIEQVLFLVQINGQLDDRALSVASDSIHPQFLEDLPGRQEIQMVSFGFGPLGAMGQGPIATGGRVFNRTRTDSTLENELRVERQSIVFRTTAYTRWDDVWQRVRRYFAALLPTYAESAPIAAISLNFQDKFRWVGDIALCRGGRLLRPQSSYVCPHVFEARDLWHSHTGAFVTADARTKRLLNVNLDCIDESGVHPPRRLVAITTAITDQLNQPGYAQIALSPTEVVDYFEREMQALHELSKQTFRNVINDTMCQRIALEG